VLDKGVAVKSASRSRNDTAFIAQNGPYCAETPSVALAWSSVWSLGMRRANNLFP